MKIQITDREKMSKHEIEEHFFKKGYEYALIHLHEGLKAEKLQGLEKVIIKHLDFLKSCEVGEMNDG